MPRSATTCIPGFMDSTFCRAVAYSWSPAPQIKLLQRRTDHQNDEQKPETPFLFSGCFFVVLPPFPPLPVLTPTWYSCGGISKPILLVRLRATVTFAFSSSTSRILRFLGRIRTRSRWNFSLTLTSMHYISSFSALSSTVGL